MKILGIHVGHDSGAALIEDGRVAAAVDEERLARMKHDADFPLASIRWCLEQAGGKVDRVAVSQDLLQSDVFKYLELASKRLLASTYLGSRKASVYNLLRAGKRLSQSDRLPPRYLRVADALSNAELFSVSHHLAHASAAYYTSGFADGALVITLDGLGDDDSFCVYEARDGRLELLHREGANGSIGWFYSVVTEALGWWIGDGEGKTMGLAPYGDARKVPRHVLTGLLPRYQRGKLSEPHDFGPVGSGKYATSFHWHFEAADEVAALAERYGKENIAALAQELLEEECLAIVKAWANETGARRLATGGGVFLNVKLNQRIVESELFDDYFIFPAPGDSGLAVGAALAAFHHDHPYEATQPIRDVYWGPEYRDEEIRALLVERRLRYQELEDPSACAAEMIADGAIVGWFQGRMEYGPRALGGRSILMRPSPAENKDRINARVKFREAFRPFCPSIKAESAEKYLTRRRPERFMITAYRVFEERASEIPAVVHVDGTARPQIVERDAAPLLWRLLDELERRTGTGVVLNTSFNIRGEPMVCSPRDALRCFFDTGLDALVMGRSLLRK